MNNTILHFILKRETLKYKLLTHLSVMQAYADSFDENMNRDSSL